MPSYLLKIYNLSKHVQLSSGSINDMFYLALTCFTALSVYAPKALVRQWGMAGSSKYSLIVYVINSPKFYFVLAVGWGGLFNLEEV